MQTGLFWGLFAAFTLLGLFVGSFLNLLIYRLPRGKKLYTRVKCPACGHELKIRDKIPLLSFLLSKGKCRYCKAPIPVRCILTEIFSALCFALCFLSFGEENVFVAAICALTCAVLLCMAFCDEENLFLPDSLQVALLLLSLTKICFLWEEWAEFFIGLAVGGGFYLLFYLGSLLILKKEGMGFGDVKLMAGMGLFLGWKKTLLCILFSSLTALFMVLARGNLKRGREYPLAPALVVGGILSLFAGDIFIELYLSII